MHSLHAPRHALCWAFIAALSISLPPAIKAQSPKPLDIYFIDTEGGQATLIVSPSGESVLIDAGFPGDRDADRIASAARLAGLTSIDRLLITHHHQDHEGGVPDLLKRVPVRGVLDHGPSVEVDVYSPGLEDLWQLHFSIAGGVENNVADRFIGNIEEQCEGHYLKASALPDGSFTIYNSRTKETKGYGAR